MKNALILENCFKNINKFKNLILKNFQRENSFSLNCKYVKESPTVFILGSIFCKTIPLWKKLFFGNKF